MRRILFAVLLAATAAPVHVSTTTLNGTAATHFTVLEHFKVDGSGFPARKRATVAFHQTRWINLASVDTRADGSFSVEVRVPPSATPGKAVLGVLVGKTPGNTNITVGAATPSPKRELAPETRPDRDRLLIYGAAGGLLLLLLGAFFILYSSRRKNRSDPDLPIDDDLIVEVDSADRPPRLPEEPADPEEFAFPSTRSAAVERLKRDVSAWKPGDEPPEDPEDAPEGGLDE